MAEQVNLHRADLEVHFADTNHCAENLLTAKLVHWADLIFVMKAHCGWLQRRLGATISDKRVMCLDTPDDDAIIQQELAQVLEEKVRRHALLSKNQCRLNCERSDLLNDETDWKLTAPVRSSKWLLSAIGA